MWKFDIETAKIFDEVELPNCPCTALARHPEQPMSAVGTKGAGFEIWDTNKNQKIFSTALKPSIQSIVSIAFCPTGTYLEIYDKLFKIII